MSLQQAPLSLLTAATPATQAPAATADPGPPRSHGPASRGPWLLVGAAVAWNLLSLRAETIGVSYLDDSSVHEQMVRFATEQFRSGHLPLDSWFPFLGLGSPQFLHYQSLPAMLTGLAGLLVGPDAAFRWTLTARTSAPGARPFALCALTLAAFAGVDAVRRRRVRSPL